MFSPILATRSTRSCLELADRVRALLLDGLHDPPGEPEELLVLGHGLGLAADGHDRPHACSSIAGEDATFGRLPPGPLCRGREALLAEELGGLVEITLGFHERPLGVHHRGAGHVAQLLDLCCGDLRHSAGTSSATAAYDRYDR